MFINVIMNALFAIAIKNAYQTVQYSNTGPKDNTTNVLIAI